MTEWEYFGHEVVWHWKCNVATVLKWPGARCCRSCGQVFPKWVKDLQRTL